MPVQITTALYKNTIIAIFCSILFLFFSSSPSAAELNTPVHIKNLGDLEHRLYYYVDESGNNSLQDILDLWHKKTSYYKPITNLPHYFGFEEGAIWIHFQITNDEDKNQQLVLEIANPFLDSIDFYNPNDNDTNNSDGFDVSHLGDTTPFSERLLKTNYFAIPFEIPANTSKHYFLKLSSQGGVELPLKLYKAVEYQSTLHLRSVGYGIFYGLVIGLALYNLFIYYSTRQIGYLYYVTFIVFSGLFWSTQEGISFELFWPNTPLLQKFMHELIITGMLIFSTLFARTYLNLFSANRFLYRLSNVAIVADLIVVVTTLILFPQYLTNVVLILTFVTSILMLIISALRLKDGYQPAIYFLVARSIYSAAAIFSVLIYSNLFIFNLPHLAILKFASALEMLIISFSLSHFIRFLQNETSLEKDKACKAEAEAKAKTEFLAKMSHEIRTPMNGVLGMAEILKSTELSEKQNNYVDVIHSSGQALLNIINDILDHSKIEAGKLELSIVPFNMEELIDECLSIFSLKASEKGLSLLSSIRPGTPLLVKGDPTRIKQVLINLLSNAFKFTDEGEIIIRAFATNQSTRHHPEIQIEVQDTGIGIPFDSQKELFKVTSHLETFLSRQFGGTGLGLSLCRNLVELMGGEIGVESETKLGSRFWFTVKLETATEKEIQPPIRAKELRGLNLLVVDDQTTHFHIIQEKTTTWGMQVDTAINARQAFRKLIKAKDDNDPFDLLLTDWSMPGKNGLELIEEIRKDPDFRFLHIILMSSSRVMPDRALLDQLNIAGTLEKPFTGDQLHDLLCSVVGANHILEEKASRIEEVDYSYLRVMVAEDNPVNQMVIRGMLKKLNIIPDIATNGLEAMELYAERGGEFDLILMDCDMPEMDGFEATRKIRAIQNKHLYKPVLIFALSAHVLEEYKLKAIQVGMNDFVSKPLQLNTLKSSLIQWRESLPSPEEDKSSKTG